MTEVIIHRMQKIYVKIDFKNQSLWSTIIVRKNTKDIRCSEKCNGIYLRVYKGIDFCFVSDKIYKNIKTLHMRLTAKVRNGTNDTLGGL